MELLFAIYSFTRLPREAPAARGSHCPLCRPLGLRAAGPQGPVLPVRRLTEAARCLSRGVEASTAHLLQRKHGGGRGG